MTFTILCIAVVALVYIGVMLYMALTAPEMEETEDGLVYVDKRR